MQGLHRRPSGVYVARVVVPPGLRSVLLRRELIQSTGTTVRAVAVVVASEVLARWRRQLHDLGRLVASGAPMDAAELLKIADGSPLLRSSGHVSLVAAGDVSGLGVEALLRAAAEDSVGLFWRAAGRDGYLVAVKDLAQGTPDEGVLIPTPDGMPPNAVHHRAEGVLAVPGESVRAVANVLLSGPNERAGLVAFDAPGRPGWLFVPNVVVHAGCGDMEVLAAQVAALQSKAAATIDATALKAARAAQRAEGRGRVQAGGKWAGKRFSDAVAEYSTRKDGLAQKLASATEREQRRRGLMLFSEFTGNPVLGKVDGDMLRTFRVEVLPTIPARLNNLPAKFKRPTMRETIDALNSQDEGRAWERLKPAMQDERVQWLRQFFGWLHTRNYLAVNPAAGLKGDTGMTRAELKAKRREDLGDEARGPFTPAELVAIFSTPTYSTGSGAHVTKGNERWRPFEYWLPLLGLFGGLRIREAAQLHLDDVLERDGHLVLDINEKTADKSVKNDGGWRIVPLHPVLLAAGFRQWCDGLRAAGYRRVFPELTFAAGDAAYAKEAKRTMSAMLLRLGMPRNGKKVYHCFRHNANDELMGVSDAAGMDALKRHFVRYKLIGHQPGDDVNIKHYTSCTIAERAAMIAGMKFDIPDIHPFDISAGLAAVRAALDNKKGARKGKEDMGPAA